MGRCLGAGKAIRVCVRVCVPLWRSCCNEGLADTSSTAMGTGSEGLQGVVHPPRGRRSPGGMDVRFAYYTRAADRHA